MRPVSEQPRGLHNSQPGPWFCSRSASWRSVFSTMTLLCHDRHGLAKSLPLSQAFRQLAAKQEEKKLALSWPEGKAELRQLDGFGVLFFNFIFFY